MGSKITTTAAPMSNGGGFHTSDSMRSAVAGASAGTTLINAVQTAIAARQGNGTFLSGTVDALVTAYNTARKTGL